MEQRRSYQNSMRLKRSKTKGAMNKMRLEQNEIGKIFSHTERRKSLTNGIKLRWDKTKGILNETEL
jgi:hypothetical protein